MSILVIGSFMMDLVVRTKRIPENGETIIGEDFSRYPGGKGANQAVSAARLGEIVTMIGKFGNDDFGDEAIETLQKENINTDYILRDNEKSTGVGSVILEENGENRIIVVPGANLELSSADLDKMKDLIKNSSILVLQLEMDIDMIEYAVTYAHANSVPIILNPAPAQQLNDDLLSKVTYLTPNESEAELLTGHQIRSVEDAEIAGKILLNKGVETVIITLAGEGALIIDQTGSYHVDGFPVNPVDSVAAGDSFNGALAVGIVKGKNIVDVVKYANAVGAITVTKSGAIPSLPYREEVKEFISNWK